MKHYALLALNDAVLGGDAWRARRLAEHALAKGIPPTEVLQAGLIAGFEELGEMFQRGEHYVPEMMVAPRALREALRVVRPRLLVDRASAMGTVVIGTVQGDIHDIGKSLVAMALEGAGFAVVDLGVDVPARRFVEAVAQIGAQFVAISAQLTSSLEAMRDAVTALEEAGLRDKVKVMVGGGPVTEKVREYAGADARGADAQAAIDLCVRWTGAERC